MDRPFVEIAHQDGGARWPAIRNIADDGAQLLPAAQARQVEMHADHAQALAVGDEIGPHSAARFECGKRHDSRFDHFDMPLHQQRVAVPTDRIRPLVQRNGTPPR